MTTTVETPAEETVEPVGGTDTAPVATSSPKHRHRTVRHVAVHGGSAGAVSAAAEVLHAFGPSALGLGVAGVAAAGAGVVAARRRRKTSRSTTRRAAATRTVRRSTKTASGHRAAAGMGRGKTGAAGRARAATPRAASRRGGGAASTAARRGQRGARAAGTGTRPRRGSAAPGSRRADAARRSGRTRRGGTGPTPLGRRAIGPAARRAARGARTQDATAARKTRPATSRPATARPAVNRPAPITRAGRAQAKASRHARHAARLATRRTARTWRDIKAGASARTTEEQQKQALRKAVAEQNTKKNTSRTAAKKKTTAAVKKTAAKKTTPKNTTRPGRAISAPGITPKDIMDANAPAPGITAAADAILEHVGGFEPENALEIGGFLAGLDHLFTTLGSSLVHVAERFGGEHPIDASVVEMVQQMGTHALNLAEYGTTAHGLFRAAHETELGRLESPRVREEDWDVERNR